MPDEPLLPAGGPAAVAAGYSVWRTGLTPRVSQQALGISTVLRCCRQSALRLAQRSAEFAALHTACCMSGQIATCAWTDWLTGSLLLWCCCCVLQPIGELMSSYGLLSPIGAGWQVGDLLKEVPDTPSLNLLAALPEPQRDCLLEAARMFVATAPTMG